MAIFPSRGNLEFGCGLQQVRRVRHVMLGPVDILLNKAAHFENPDTVFDVTAITFHRYLPSRLGHPRY
jgi:hypothetical protein